MELDFLEFNANIIRRRKVVLYIRFCNMYNYLKNLNDFTIIL